MKRIAPFVFIAFAAIGLLGTPSTAFAQAVQPISSPVLLRVRPANWSGTISANMDLKGGTCWNDEVIAIPGAYIEALNCVTMETSYSVEIRNDPTADLRAKEPRRAILR